VVCKFGVIFMPGRGRGMAEMAQVLKYGGIFAVSTWDTLGKNALPGLGQRVLETFFDADPPIFLSVPLGLHDHGAIAALFEGAGIADSMIEAVAFPYERPAARDLAIGMVTGNPEIHEINERATTPAEEIIDAVAAAMAAEFGDSPLKATAIRSSRQVLRGSVGRPAVTKLPAEGGLTQ